MTILFFMKLESHFETKVSNHHKYTDFTHRIHMVIIHDNTSPYHTQAGSSMSKNVNKN